MSEQLTTESQNIKGRWIRYVHTDEDSGRERIAVTQIVAVEVTYARPQEHRHLDKSEKMYVDWLLNQDGEGKIAKIVVLTLSPEQVMVGEDPQPMVTVDYSALGKPMKIIEFSLATVQEVLIAINKLAFQHPERASMLVEQYHMEQQSDKTLVFSRR